MSTTHHTETTGRPMSVVARRFEELGVAGVRPDALAWAVGEASDTALALAGANGREMVRRCLAEARRPHRSGAEAEALLLIAAAGVESLRGELRSLGVDLEMSRFEAFERMRRTEKPDTRTAMAAIRGAGAVRVMEAMDDRAVPFPSAIAEEIVKASALGDEDRVAALCTVVALGVRALRRGLELDVSTEMGEPDPAVMARVVAQKNPRRALRQHARHGQGPQAEALAALSFVRSRWLVDGWRSMRHAAEETRSPLTEPLGIAEVDATRPLSAHDRGRSTGLGRVGDEAMTSRCGTSKPAPVDSSPDLSGDAIDALQRAVGATAPALRACLRVRARDLVIASGAGIALYSLRVASTWSGWEQRLLAFPPEQLVRDFCERSDWARRARELCLSSQTARACRVPVGVVAAEARACEGEGETPDLEEAVYRVSLAAAAAQLAAGGRSAKAGRTMIERVEWARHPSHVPLRHLQLALAEEVALGRTLGALCSRSAHFSRAGENGSATSALCRGLGLQGTRVGRGQLRYARVAPHQLAEKLCEALDMAPEEVGL